MSLQPVIITSDLDRLVRFYSALFGAVESSRVDGEGGAPFFVGLRIGDSELGVVADAGAPTGSAQRILLSVDVRSVDELLEQVAVHGGRVLGPPDDMPWGQRVAHVHDPDGNSVNLTQPITAASVGAQESVRHRCS